MQQSSDRDDAKGARPEFSIVIPCWNAARTLEETLVSIRDQTFESFEVIVVDDGSTDETPAMLARWSEADPRFRSVRRANGGPSRARNLAALDLARGRYIAFLDADDVWPEDKLALAAEALDADPGLAGVYGKTAFFRDRPESARTFSHVPNGPLTPAELLRGNAVCTMSNVTVRADVFRATGGFDPSIVYNEDLEWLVRLTAAGARVEGIDQVMVYYRSSDGGLSINTDLMLAGWKTAAAAAQTAGCVLAPATLRAAEAMQLRLLARRALRGQAPRFAALRLAVRGALCSPAGFFADPARALLTLMAAAVEPLLPNGVRRLALQF